MPSIADVEREYDQLFTCPVGQSRHMRLGFTRAQGERMFARLNAVKTATRTKYADGRTVKDIVDLAIQTGHVIYRGYNRWTTLERTPENIIRFSSAVERDYILTCLNAGKFARNY